MVVSIFFGDDVVVKLYDGQSLQDEIKVVGFFEE